MTRELEGRVALVTGAARNIGRAIALDLAAAGAAVLVHANSSADLAAGVVREIEAKGGRARMHLADVTVPEQAAATVAAAVEAFGGLDILVSNAALRKETAFEAMSFAEWREVLAVILDGAFLTAQAAVPHLRASDGASIITIGGMSAHAGSAGRVHVTTAKAGIVGFTHGLAHDLGPDGITVNCVVPGLIGTQRAPQQGGEPAHHARHATLLGRRGTPEEVAGLVRYLAGPSARYITGQTLHVNGGAFLS
ncbi:SDR family NAD(P)-dependent oxidoreductase [Inquilinus sp.]|jgi:3-oxoacyl-[acyl-carrier protein] reductase|uniref:SDR family NAD(P)-dependent oxidoreductase n=1 Tax=Inquilinus sp. TaxID=1932117 RepID=UPI0037840444